MALAHENQTPFWTGLFLYTNNIFTFIYACEAVLKLIGFGWSYFKNNWNRFDFFVVNTALLDLVLNKIFEGSQSNFLLVGPQIARVIRVLRVTRVIKLAN